MAAGSEGSWLKGWRKGASRYEKLTSVACSFVLGVCKHNRSHLSSLTVEMRSGLTVAGLVSLQAL